MGEDLAADRGRAHLQGGNADRLSALDATGETVKPPLVHEEADGAAVHAENRRVRGFAGEHSVRKIYTYYKHFGYETEVMGASFRNVGQILELAGCDLLTISPELMRELSASYGTVDRKLAPENAMSADIERLELNERKFRYLLNDDAMATEKTAEGIRKFAADIAKLEKVIAGKIA